MIFRSDSEVVPAGGDWEASRPSTAGTLEKSNQSPIVAFMLDPRSLFRASTAADGSTDQLDRRAPCRPQPEFSPCKAHGHADSRTQLARLACLRFQHRAIGSDAARLKLPTFA